MIHWILKTEREREKDLIIVLYQIIDAPASPVPYVVWMGSRFDSAAIFTPDTAGLPHQHLALSKLLLSRANI